MPRDDVDTMRWCSPIPDKAALIRLYKVAKRRLTGKTGDASELPDRRIVSATADLNRIADDIRDASGVPNAPPPDLQREPLREIIHTVGKILRGK